MYLTDIDGQAARDRYEEHLTAAAHRKLVCEARAAKQRAAAPARASSLLARLRGALLTRRPARAES